MSRLSEKEIIELLQEKILVLDGAMGTNIQSQNLTEADYGGESFYGCNEHLVITKPDAIRKVHRDFLEAGADIIESCTFGSTSLVLDEYGLADRAYEITLRGVELARDLCDEYSRPGHPRLVAGSMGPTTRAISVTGGVTLEELEHDFYDQARAMLDGGVDLFLLETAQDTLNLKAALFALQRLRRESGIIVPVMVSGTVEITGTMLAGQGVEALVNSLEHLRPLSFGINCATGPSFMKDHVRTLSSVVPGFVSCYPNAGLPDEDGNYNESPAQLAAELGLFCDSGWINFLGGCCGTRPAHIQAVAEMAATKAPRRPDSMRVTRVSGVDPLVIEEEGRPYLVGERTNSLGSKKFRDLIAAKEYGEAAEIGRRQVRGGAHIIDVCLQNPDGDELADMHEFLPLLIKKVRLPIMIDTTRFDVLEAGLRYIQGKSLYNSVNLEDGEERFEKVAELYHKYGFSLVVGCIDEDPQHGMGVTVARKLEIAERSYKLLTEKYGVRGEDLIFDPLVFPVGSGDEAYIGSAKETIEGVRAIKERFTEVKTILGVSNVSFGLPPAGREVLNSVFVYYAVKAGLDMAIVNTEKLQRYPSLSDEEKRLSEALLYSDRTSYDKALHEFNIYFKEKKSGPSALDRSHLSVNERLALHILEGAASGIRDDLDIALKDMAPLDIINGPLMEGMAEVGRQFNRGELIVAEVLQSAEAMKAGVAHLQAFMGKEDIPSRGRMLLATVKGDVHDIGKNLVDIIFSNNGYEVINLGIKIAPQQLIEACLKYKPDVIGLSGLLVKSAEQMIITAADLKAREIDLPIFVGGAALSEKFVRNKIGPEYDGAVIYARDAMQGLELLNAWSIPAKREALLAEWTWGGSDESAGQSLSAKEEAAPLTAPTIEIRHDYGAQSRPDRVPDLKFHRSKDFDTSRLFDWINPVMLYKKHLGWNRDLAQSANDPDFLKLKARIEEVQSEALSSGVPAADGYWKFFRAAGDGNDLVILSDDGKSERERFHLPRQKRGKGLSIADFVAPLGSGLDDFVAIFVVTAGIGVREKAERLKEAGSYLDSHALQAIALESAEAFAELLHADIRRAWGFADPAELAREEIFRARYRGCRYSFGYPACPDLGDQEKLFRLLELPKDFPMALTEGFSMDPEASVSAIVLQHPQADYFSVL